MLVLDGKRVSDDLKNNLRQGVEDFKAKYHRTPTLKVVIIGDDPASQVYVRNKHLACQKIGMESEVIRLPVDSTQAQVLSVVEKLNSDPLVDGILVQLPVPKSISTQAIFETIDVSKDADGITYLSTGYLWSGLNHVRPCTPSGVIKILKFYQIPLRGKRALVIGRSQIVGRPMAALLLEEGATVTIAHRDTLDLRHHLLQSEIVVVAAGQPQFLGKDDFPENCVVIDVGIHGSGTGKLCGDVKFDEVVSKVKAITPVPGGVGPMTIACLLENTLILAHQRELKKKSLDQSNK